RPDAAISAGHGDAVLPRGVAPPRAPCLVDEAGRVVIARASSPGCHPGVAGLDRAPGVACDAGALGQAGPARTMGTTWEQTRVSLDHLWAPGRAMTIALHNHLHRTGHPSAARRAPPPAACPVVTDQ